MINVIEMIWVVCRLDVHGILCDRDMVVLGLYGLRVCFLTLAWGWARRLTQVVTHYALAGRLLIDMSWVVTAWRFMFVVWHQLLVVILILLWSQSSDILILLGKLSFQIFTLILRESLYILFLAFPSFLRWRVYVETVVIAIFTAHFFLKHLFLLLFHLFARFDSLNTFFNNINDRNILNQNNILYNICWLP